VHVKRRDGSIFDARMYVSPLIDAQGPPDRLDDLHDRHHRAQAHPEELSASYERFTTVLESLDSAVSVAPLGSDEMLFANKMYRLWFGTDAVKGTGTWLALAGNQPPPAPTTAWTPWTPSPACPPKR
jgi:hypothetical protein